MNEAKADICFGVLYGSDISFRWTVESALRTQFPAGSLVAFPETVTGVFTDTACTRIVDVALARNAEHVFVVHSDISWPYDAVSRMIAHDKNIVMGWSRGRTAPHVLQVATDYNEEKELWKIGGKPKDCGLEEVVAVGGGMWCFRTEIFKKIPKPWFKIKSKDDGTCVTEDFYFCRKAREHGFKVFVDWSIHNKHKADGLVSGRDGLEYFK